MSAQHDATQHPHPTPPPLTADEVRGATFQQSPLAWRGYSEQEVDGFIARVAETLEDADRENAALRTEIDRLRNVYRRHGTDIDHLVDRPSRATGAVTSQLIVEAQEYIGTQLAQADAYAELVTVDARHQAEHLLAHAELRARIMAEDMIGAYLARTIDTARAQRELDLLQAWLHALADALWAQTGAMAQPVEAELQRRGAPPSRSAQHAGTV
jgi:DivIVA domain-containing protein